MLTCSRTPVWLLAAAVLFVSCKGRESSSGERKEPAAEEQPPQPPKEVKAVQTVGAATPTLTLGQPGQEPRRVIAYSIPSRTRKAHLAIEMSLPDTSPERKFTVDVEVLLSPPGKDGRRVFRVGETKVEAGEPAPSPGEQSAIDTIAANFKAVEGYVTTKGPHHFTYVQTAGLRTQTSLPWLLHALTVPLPINPVGTGARWSYRQATQSRYETPAVEQRMYELAELGADGAVVKLAGSVDYDEKSTPQPPSETRLLANKITVHGELHVGLSDPLPVSGELTVEREMTWWARPKGALPHEAGPEEQIERSVVKVTLSSE